MKIGLEKLPGVSDLEAAYNQILLAQRTQGAQSPQSPQSLGLDLPAFTLYCQWSRFDSRLGEICVRFLSENWRKINPIALNESVSYRPWPNVIGVLLEFCSESEEARDPLFQMWKKTVTYGLSKANWEQFFIGKRRVGGKEMLDDARFPLEQYRKWGYLSRETLLNKGGKFAGGGGDYSQEVRAVILSDLLQSHERITTRLYRQALDNRISLRQAERDLKTSKLLRAVGNTQGRFFIKVKQRSSHNG